MLSPDTPIERLPVLPRLHDGRVDSMRLVRQVDGQRWVLRLWPTDVRISGNDTPLFVRTIEIQNQRHMAGLITAARDTGEYDHPLDALEQVLDDRSTVKSVSRKSNEIQVNREHRRLHWRGKVLLVCEKADL
jgi:hypothetical protein